MAWVVALSTFSAVLVVTILLLSFHTPLRRTPHYVLLTGTLNLFFPTLSPSCHDANVQPLSDGSSPSASSFYCPWTWRPQQQTTSVKTTQKIALDHSSTSPNEPSSSAGE